MLEDHPPAVPGAPPAGEPVPAGESVPAGEPVSAGEPPARAVPAGADGAPAGAGEAPADVGEVPAGAPSPGQPPGRIRRSADSAQRWVTSERTRLLADLTARRQRSGMVDAGFQVQELDARVGGGILAGALAFRIFLFMVPFVYVVFTALGAVFGAVSQDPTQVARNIGITGVLASAVVKTQDQNAWTLGLLVTGATFALFLTAGSLLKALYVVHWLIWRVPRVMPTGLMPRLALIGIVLAASVLGAAINYLRNFTGIPGAVIAVALITMLSFALWWWLSWKLPHAPGPPRALIPGALLMAIGVDVLHLLTTYWIGHLVARKTNTYGPVGIALAVLLWVYILGRIIVASAGLNAALAYRSHDH